MSTRSATPSRLARGSEWFLSPSRIAGVDLARGLAVIGMLAAHLLTIDAFDAGRPETWIDIANGRSSILFATLAGRTRERVGDAIGEPLHAGKFSAASPRAGPAIRAE